MEDRTNVWFAAHDYMVEASVITELMQVEPTQILVIGQPRPKVPKMLSRTNMWQLSSSLPISAHVQDHIESLLSLLEPRTEAIVTLQRVHQAKVGINCAIYYEDFTPGIHLSQSITKRIAGLGLYVDLDLYFLGDSQKFDTAPPTGAPL